MITQHYFDVYVYFLSTDYRGILRVSATIYWKNASRGQAIHRDKPQALQAIR